MTGSGNLASHGVKKICHAIDPVYSSDPSGAPAILQSAYRSCVQQADALGMTTIAFPAISEGNNGFPPAQAAPIALRQLVDDLSNVRFLQRATLVLTPSSFQVHYKALKQLAAPYPLKQ